MCLQNNREVALVESQGSIRKEALKDKTTEVEKQYRTVALCALGVKLSRFGSMLCYLTSCGILGKLPTSLHVSVSLSVKWR